MQSKREKFYQKFWKTQHAFFVDPIIAEALKTGEYPDATN